MLKRVSADIVSGVENVKSRRMKEGRDIRKSKTEKGWRGVGGEKLRESVFNLCCQARSQKSILFSVSITRFPLFSFCCVFNFFIFSFSHPSFIPSALSSRPKTHKHMCLTFLRAEQIHPICFHCVCVCVPSQ